MLFYKIPRIMADGRLRLRPVRIYDASALLKGFGNEGFPIAVQKYKMPVPLWLSLWWWIRKSFLPAYCIEYDTECIGFMGLYKLRLGESAGLSLLIFIKQMRRHGYGTRAFKLLVQNLQRHSVVKKIFIEVRRDNTVALSFWKKMGFVQTDNHNGIIRMYLNISPEIT